jgi:ABC-type nitrate/sulfonate/bicarbonate transport system permease component
LLVAFEVWARAIHLQSDSLAPPSEIVTALFGAFADLSILAATRDTLFSAFAGLAIGTIIGLALGIAFGISDTLNRLMEVTVEAIRPIPSIALLPIALIALGFGYRMEIVIVAFACVWPILILSRAAVRSIEPRLSAGAAAAAGATGLEDHHPGGAAADFRGVPPVGRHRADRRRHGRDRDKPAWAWRRHHAGAAGAAPRSDAGLSDLDRHHRLRAEHPSDRGPTAPVRPRRVERRRPMNRAVIMWRMASFAVAAGFIALWQLIANLKLVSPVFLPGPDRAWAALVRGFSSGDLWSKLAGTLEHMAYGWLAASIAGIAIGAIIGSSRTMRTYVAPSLEFLRPLPVSAIIPVAIAMLGLTQAMALFVIAFGAIWPIMLATIHGFAAVEPRLYEVARSLQMSRLAVISKIALPSASPDILAGMRLSLTVALILSVVCEILAGLDGLGHWVLLSARAFRSADLFAGVILLGVTGYVTSVAMSMAEHRLLAWQAAQR